ncbi:MAG TPA: thioredoxin [Bacteroidales bacterium]|nr:thioredoxin [Bacteroidales bacterium]
MTSNFSEIINSEIPVLVDFSAEWCGPCKMMKPVLEQLKDKMENKIRIIKIDVDKNSELAGKYRVQSVPTLMLFQNGKTIWSGIGVKTSNYLENVIINNSTVISD